MERVFFYYKLTNIPSINRGGTFIIQHIQYNVYTHENCMYVEQSKTVHSTAPYPAFSFHYIRPFFSLRFSNPSLACQISSKKEKRRAPEGSTLPGNCLMMKFRKQLHVSDPFFCSAVDFSFSFRPVVVVWICFYCILLFCHGFLRNRV